MRICKENAHRVIGGYFAYHTAPYSMIIYTFVFQIGVFLVFSLLIILKIYGIMI